jgi:hypothetical protein
MVRILTLLDAAGLEEGKPGASGQKAVGSQTPSPAAKPKWEKVSLETPLAPRGSLTYWGQIFVIDRIDPSGEGKGKDKVYGRGLDKSGTPKGDVSSLLRTREQLAAPDSKWSYAPPPVDQLPAAGPSARPSDSLRTGLEEGNSKKARAALWNFLEDPTIQEVIHFLVEPPQGGTDVMARLESYFDREVTGWLSQAGYKKEMLSLIWLKPLEDAPGQLFPAVLRRNDVSFHIKPVAVFVQSDFSETVKKNFAPAHIQEGRLRFVENIKDADLVIGAGDVSIRPDQALLEVNFKTAFLVTYEMLYLLQEKGLLGPGAIVRLHDVIQIEGLGKAVLTFA